MSDLTWEALEWNYGDGDCTLCIECGGSVCCGGCGCVDRGWEEDLSWEEHRERMMFEGGPDDLLVGVWFTHHVVNKYCLDADGVCDNSCDDLARFVVRACFP